MSSQYADGLSRKRVLEEGEVDDDEYELANTEPDVEAILAEKRRRRQAILAKHQNDPVEPQTKKPKLTQPDTPEPERGNAFDLSQAHHAPMDASAVSAADYNPDADGKADAERAVQKEVQWPGADADPKPSGESGGESEWEEVEVDEDEDEEDMFAIASTAPAKKKTVRRRKTKANQTVSNMVVIARQDATAIVDEQDDAEGYYKVILGELLDDGRYHVHANLGRGMFSSVVRAKDLQESGKEVAIKIIRSQESMYKAGQKEVGILKKLNEADPTDKRHLVRLHRTFEHRKHLCLVFESLNLNLREVVKRFGKDVGINLKAVRAYAHQMFLGLSLMKKCNIIHADLKPDNLLVNENHSQLKISDLGSASDVSENEITPYLVSRFYRAPEIILGLPYDCSIDMWSIGCTLYELYTGKILFPGRNNNQMLLHIQQTKGRLNNRIIKRSTLGNMHFDEAGSFVTSEPNKATGTEVIKKLHLPNKPTADLKSRLMPPGWTSTMSAEEVKMLGHFVDLLERSLDLDPTKRLTPADALKHAFLR